MNDLVSSLSAIASLSGTSGTDPLLAALAYASIALNLSSKDILSRAVLAYTSIALDLSSEVICAVYCSGASFGGAAAFSDMFSGSAYCVRFSLFGALTGVGVFGEASSLCDSSLMSMNSGSDIFFAFGTTYGGFGYKCYGFD